AGDTTGSTIRGGGLDGLDHPGWWSRRARPPGLVVSTGSTTRGGGLDGLDHPGISTGSTGREPR
ncbi:MAG: hypothetical protein ACJ72A_00635, partial [Nocardioidaceae bacterium]